MCTVSFPHGGTMELKGNKEALRILKKSRGGTLIEKLLTDAGFEQLEHFVVFADMHVRGSATQKGVRFKYVNDIDGAVIHVQAGDNGTCVSCKVKRKGRVHFDYQAFSDRLLAALREQAARPTKAEEVVTPAPPKLIEEQASPSRTATSFAKPDEHAIGIVLLELLSIAEESGSELPRERVVETVAREMSVEPRGTGPFIRSMTTSALGLLKKTESGTFVIDAVAARHYIDSLGIRDATDRYRLPRGAEFLALVSFQGESDNQGNPELRMVASSLADDVLEHATEIRANIGEIEGNLVSLRANYDTLARLRAQLVQRLGHLDQQMRMKADEAKTLAQKHALMVASFWDLVQSSK